MTPLMIFQWPLSPSGTFQPVKSRPLKSETKPAGDCFALLLTCSAANRLRLIKHERTKLRILLYIMDRPLKISTICQLVEASGLNAMSRSQQANNLSDLGG